MINAILPKHEIHHVSDCDDEYNDNKSTYVLFEYTTEDWCETLNILNENNIKYIVKTDSLDLDYILIE